MAAKDTGTEQLIKDTAKKIFFSEGRLHATTQDIADAAGVNRTLVHYYFRSRELLFEQVVQEAEADLRNTLDSVFKRKINFKDKLKKLIDVFIDQTMAYPYRELFVITETNRHNEIEVEEIHESYIKPFLDEAKKEMEKGNLKLMSPKQFMMNLFALMAYPVLAGPLNKKFLKIGEAEFGKLMKQRKQIIFEMIYTGE